MEVSGVWVADVIGSWEVISGSAGATGTGAETTGASCTGSGAEMGVSGTATGSGLTNIQLVPSNLSDSVYSRFGFRSILTEADTPKLHPKLLH